MVGGLCVSGKDGRAGRIMVGESVSCEEAGGVIGEYSGERTEGIVSGRWISVSGSSGNGETVQTRGGELMSILR